MEWPSRNIPQGGILHPAKVSYSPDTKQFLKLIMDESKLSMMQRKKVDYFLRNDEPLSNLTKLRREPRNPHVPEVLIKPSSSKRRSHESIVKSGLYERDTFVPFHPRVDRQMEIKRLQDKMAFNEEVHTKQLVNKLEKTDEKDEGVNLNRFDEIMREIKERENWLKEMEKLGEGKKYRLLIQQQIQEKIREMNELSFTEY